MGTPSKLRRDGARAFSEGRPPRSPVSFGASDWLEGYEQARMKHESEQAARRELDERYRYMPASYRISDELGELIGSEAVDKIKELFEAMLYEREKGSDD